MDYIELVRDIRFCQNTYLKPRIGTGLLKAVIAYLNDGTTTDGENAAGVQGGTPADATVPGGSPSGEALDELATLLRTALAFYVESRRVELGPKREKLARRDSMTDAQQAMAMACQYIEDNLDALGDAAMGTPIYIHVKEQEAQAQRDAEHREQAECRRRREACQQNNRKLFTGFPATHRTPEYKT
jgi:hypothetical protein